MSTVPFVAQLRARPDAIRLGTGDAPVITVRVQIPEIWDTVRIDAPPDSSVLTIKQRALAALVAGAGPEEWVVKLNGFEVMDESSSIADAGARNGSTFLVTSRRRRPVR